MTVVRLKQYVPQEHTIQEKETLIVKTAKPDIIAPAEAVMVIVGQKMLIILMQRLLLVQLVWQVLMLRMQAEIGTVIIEELLVLLVLWVGSVTEHLLHVAQELVRITPVRVVVKIVLRLLQIVLIVLQPLADAAVAIQDILLLVVDAAVMFQIALLIIQAADAVVAIQDILYQAVDAAVMFQIALLIIQAADAVVAIQDIN